MILALPEAPQIVAGLDSYEPGKFVLGGWWTVVREQRQSRCHFSSFRADTKHARPLKVLPTPKVPTYLGMKYALSGFR